MRVVYKGYGFTLIELIITIVLLGIILIPLGLMSLEFTREIVYSRDLGVAEGLAKIEMSKVNNLSYTDTSLADGTDTTTANYEGYAYALRRIVNFVAGSSNNLKKVELRVYPSGNSTSHLVKMVTYIASVAYGVGSQGSTTGSGGNSDFLLISGGVVAANKLHQLDMANSHATDTITVSAVTVSWTNSNNNNPASLTSIEMGGSVRWSGTESTSGATTTLTSAFTLSANTTYDNTGTFNFSQNITSVTVTFIMSDGSATAAITF